MAMLHHHRDVLKNILYSLHNPLDKLIQTQENCGRDLLQWHQIAVDSIQSQQFSGQVDAIIFWVALLSALSTTLQLIHRSWIWNRSGNNYYDTGFKFFYLIASYKSVITLEQVDFVTFHSLLSSFVNKLVPWCAWLLKGARNSEITITKECRFKLIYSGALILITIEIMT